MSANEPATRSSSGNWPPATLIAFCVCSTSTSTLPPLSTARFGRSAGKAGNVISAVYKTPDRIELNFLRASRDLATYARLQKLSDQLAVFVMTPACDSMPAGDFERVEDVLGEQSWNLEQQGFLVSVHDSAMPLAKDIWDWAGLTV